MSRKSRIRVLHVVPSLAHGGTEQLLYDVLSRLDKTRFEISIFCTHGVGDPRQYERFQAADIQTYVLPYSATRLRRVLVMYKYLRHGMFDIVHIHNYESNVLYARIAAILAMVPVIMTYDHNVHPGWLSWWNQMIWQVLNPFTYGNVVISRAVHQYRTKCCGKQPWKVTTITDGIDVDFFHSNPKRYSFKAKASIVIDPRKKVAGAIGRLISWKRFDLLIEAAALLNVKRDTEFVLVGDGPLESKLRDLTEDLGVGDSFHFLGWQPNIRDIYQALDVFVATSNLAEGFGLVAAEAMAMGIPVVAVNSPTYIEVIGDCGLLVEPEPEKIAEAVLHLLNDEDLALTLAKRGRERVKEYFNINRTVKELGVLYLKAFEKFRR